MNTHDILERTVFIALHGSQLYGTNLPTSDYEYRGIFVGDQNHYLGNKKIEVPDINWLDTLSSGDRYYHSLKDAPDSSFYEVGKFLKLAAANNPSILDSLYSEPFVMVHKAFQPVIVDRDYFLSKRVAHTYAGYACDQYEETLERQGWLLKLKEDPNYLSVCPQPADFGIDTEVMDKSDRNAFLHYLGFLLKNNTANRAVQDIIFDHFGVVDFAGLLINKGIPDEVLEISGAFTNATKDFMNLYSKSQNYVRAVKEYKKFQHWKSHRNKSRAALEEKCGYDSKNMSHCIRLLTMGVEILEGKGVIPRRNIAGDADMLKAIRMGDYSWDQISELYKEGRYKLALARTTTTLPDEVSHDFVNDLQIELVKSYGI